MRTKGVAYRLPSYMHGQGPTEEPFRLCPITCRPFPRFLNVAATRNAHMILKYFSGISLTPPAGPFKSGRSISCSRWQVGIEFGAPLWVQLGGIRTYSACHSHPVDAVSTT